MFLERRGKNRVEWVSGNASVTIKPGKIYQQGLFLALSSWIWKVECEFIVWSWGLCVGPRWRSRRLNSVSHKYFLHLFVCQTFDWRVFKCVSISSTYPCHCVSLSVRPWYFWISILSASLAPLFEKLKKANLTQPTLFQTERSQRLVHLPRFCELVSIWKAIGFACWYFCVTRELT